MVRRMRLFVSDANYEVHAEMGSQVRENQQLEEFQTQNKLLRQYVEPTYLVGGGEG